MGHVLVPALRAPQGRGARVRGADRVSGRAGTHERAPAGRGRRAAAAPRALRLWQLLHHARRERRSRPRVCGTRRCGGSGAGRRARLPRLAGHLRRRLFARRINARHRRPGLHGRRRRTTGIFRRNAQGRSAGHVDAAAAGAADCRSPDVIAAPTHLGVAARDRTGSSRCVHRRRGCAAHRRLAAMAAARCRLPVQLATRSRARTAPAVDQHSSPRAPASAS